MNRICSVCFGGLNVIVLMYVCCLAVVLLVVAGAVFYIDCSSSFVAFYYA